MTIQINNLNGNVNIYNNERVQSTLNDAAVQPNDTAKPTNDARSKKLFLNEFGDEDPQRTTEESQRVRRYLADHNFGNRQLDSARDNPLNVMAICFCAKWQTLHYLTPPVSATALLRFLSDDCGIALATEPKPIANVLAKMLKAPKDNDTYSDVCDYF